MKLVALFLCSAACCCAAGASVPESQGDDCPSPSWVQFNNNCYTFLHETLKNSLNIGVARDLCKVSGADIISVNSEGENAFLLNMFQTEWKGPQDILLGLFYDVDDNSLKWYDNSEVTFTNWRDEQQQVNEDLSTCIKMNTESGLWDVISCEHFLEIGTLCKMRSNIQKEKKQTGQKALLITLIITVALLVGIVSTVLLVLYKGKPLSSGFMSRNQHVVSQVLPYSDETILVDSMEKEDSA
ncbi:CD302 antigen [Bombina bombina]|uniref:CD302 antigen n=1 Tax=Bombina bombina TaxID=8345 RepID=UPI00235A5717|nr:CD302 antigen [Bombina bombina]